VNVDFQFHSASCRDVPDIQGNHRFSNNEY
jgi:hypothetical protein